MQFVITEVSVILPASFEAVFDVHGATTIISVIFLGPIGSASAMDVITSFPHISLNLFTLSSAEPKRVETVEAFSDITGISFAPIFFSISACSKHFLNVQNEPVTAKPILSPLNTSFI